MKRVLIDDAADKVTERAVRETALRKIPPGSLLVVTRSGILARTLPVAITAVPVVINQDLRALTPSPEVDPLFLRQQLVFLEDQILQSTVKPGTTVESVEFKALRRIQVDVPPLKEQKAIAARLSEIIESLEAARAELRSVLALLEFYQRAVLLKALSGQLTEGSSAREVTLEEIAEIHGGLALGKRYRETELISRPYIRVANVQRGWLDLADVRDVLVSPMDSERYKLRAGDILMNEGGDRDKLGRGWVWEDQIPNCLHQNHVFRVRLKDPEFPPTFISLYANELGREYFEAAAKQTTNLASISKARLGKLPIRLPSPSEATAALKAFEERTEWIDAFRRQVLDAIADADAAEQASMRKAFQGRLVPWVLDEPAPTFGAETAAREPTTARQAGRQEKGTKVNTLLDLIDRWPRGGLTFEAVRDQVPSDYESLKDAIFEMLAGAEPKLEQRFSPKDKAMRFFRRRP